MTESIFEPICNFLTHAVGFGVGVIIALIALNAIKCHEHRKNVLKAIKDLNIEDELARCPFGVDCKLFNAIKTYLWEHNLPDPFVGRGSVLDMTIVIADLRKKGKIKPLEPAEKAEKADELSKETTCDTPCEDGVSTLKKWMDKWGFKRNLNMLQLMQYRLDEYKGDYRRSIIDMVYSRPIAKEYLVTVHGEYVFVSQNTLVDMESDFVNTNTIHELHLFAIPKDWVDEMINKHPELILTDVE